MTAARLTLAVEDPDTLDGRRLVRALWAALGRLYGDNGPCRFAPADVAGVGCAFVVARLEGDAIGCGALKPLGPGVVEMKRMFVRPDARRLGAGGAILGRLETVAVTLGYHTVRLETGIRQPDAIRLYERAGYRRIDPLDAWGGDPLSVSYERRLTAT